LSRPWVPRRARDHRDGASSAGSVGASRPSYLLTKTGGDHAMLLTHIHTRLL
jgi:hypothetical protein